MIYQEHPVYEDPGSNHWIGNQVETFQRISELYWDIKINGDMSGGVTAGGLSIEDACAKIMDKWVQWSVDNIKFDADAVAVLDGDVPDNTWAIPSSLIWYGQPELWTGTVTENSSLKCEIECYSRDIGATASWANGLIYYASAVGATEPNINGTLGEQALYVAKKMIDYQWEQCRDDIGLTIVESNNNLTRFFEESVYVPTTYHGTMPNGDPIENGATFLSIRTAYTNDPDYDRLKSEYDNTGNVSNVNWTYHRFGNQCEVLMANGVMATLYPNIEHDTPCNQIVIKEDSIILDNLQDTYTITISSGYADSFTSSNEDVAIVDSNGKITAIGNGTATIIATGPENAFDSVEVIVKAQDVTTPKVTTATTTTTTTTTTDITTTTLATNVTDTTITTKTEPLITTTVSTTTDTTTTTTTETVTAPPIDDNENSNVSKKDNSLIFDDDIWNFTNSMIYFGSGSYYISDIFYNNLMDKISNTEKQSMINFRNRNWKGSCYGLSVLPILYKNGIFNVSDWQVGAECLHDIEKPNNDDIESLINYYYLLQKTDNIQQAISRSLYYENNEEKLQKLVELSSKVSEGGSPVLLCFYGQSYGHAVTAYGVEDGSWTKNGVKYTHRVLIYDSNYSEFNDDACLYYNDNGRFTIPAYKISYNPQSESNTLNLGLITNDINLLNNNGYIGKNKYTSEYDYITMMQTSPISTDYSIDKIPLDNSGAINADNDDFVEFYDFMSSDTNTKSDLKWAFIDSYIGYKLNIDSGVDLLDTTMSYENSLLSAYSNKAKSVEFLPNGYIEIQADGSESDFNLGMVFNEGYYDLSWYNMKIEGHNCNDVSMEKVDDGFVLCGDNLVNVKVSANNDDVSTWVKFSTDYEKVLVYEIDENTIGISVDTDENGTFDTIIAQTSEVNIGDMNDDADVNAHDLLMLKKYVLNMITQDDINMDNADLNNDGDVNAFDVLLLKKVILQMITMEDLQQYQS